MDRASATDSVDSGFDSQSGQTEDNKNWLSQLPCLTYTDERASVKPPPYVVGRQVGRWQLDSKTERSPRYLLAKATW